jgi:Fe-S-cluster containining protein
MEIARGPETQRIRYNKLVKLVDQAAVEILPFTACRKGCSHCCSIAVLISDVEAQRIGEAIRRKPVKTGAFPADVPALQDKYFGVPCTFLKAGRCSIYDVRPLACRLHFNMADDSLFCSTAIAPQNSLVPALNLHGVDKALFVLTFGSLHADIRDFFPK